MSDDINLSARSEKRLEPDWLSYHPSAGGYDEAFEANGDVRPHWQGLLQSLAGSGLSSLKHRWSEARHLIRQNGVTYNVYGDPRGMAQALATGSGAVGVLDGRCGETRSGFDSTRFVT
jgi:hypothetical protein